MEREILKVKAFVLRASVDICVLAVFESDHLSQLL